MKRRCRTVVILVSHDYRSKFTIPRVLCSEELTWIEQMKVVHRYSESKSLDSSKVTWNSNNQRSVCFNPVLLEAFNVNQKVNGFEFDEPTWVLSLMWSYTISAHLEKVGNEKISTWTFHLKRSRVCFSSQRHRLLSWFFSYIYVRRLRSHLRFAWQEYQPIQERQFPEGSFRCPYFQRPKLLLNPWIQHTSLNNFVYIFLDL